jgi:hypothetical protein
MLEESDTMSLLGEEQDKPPTLFQTFKFYITHPKVYDWIMGILFISAVIATIVICVL